MANEHHELLASLIKVLQVLQVFEGEAYLNLVLHFDIFQSLQPEELYL